MKVTWKNFRLNTSILVLLTLIQGFSVVSAQAPQQSEKINKDAFEKLKNYPEYFQAWKHVGKMTLDSIRANSKQKKLRLYFSGNLGYIPIRESYVDSIRSLIQRDLGKEYGKFRIELYTGKVPLEDYIPNAYRHKTFLKKDRLNKASKTKIQPILTDLNKPIFPKGLSNNHIALWHAHGWYYEAKVDRWEWQRARLFGTLEDVGPMTYVLPFIAPMLENAGATTFIPRERDTQIHEVIVDNDQSTGNSECIVVAGKEKWNRAAGKGFAWKDTLYNNENPFELGSYLSIKSVPKDTARVIYLPEIPETGEYAVYLSWAVEPGNSNRALYTVYHAGGKSQFAVNQQMGGKTWIYVGKFSFLKGKNFATGRVEITNAGKGKLTTDAVRFGGGMGNVARKPSDEYVALQWSLAGAKKESLPPSTELKEANYTWKTGERVRFLEGARYYLQYSGIPRTVYTPNKGKNDYNDDYQSRGDWVNYLMGQHRDADKDSILTGLNIPIDLSFAFHTDAGITPNDSIIGTLAIYNTTHGDSLFPSGQSRLSSRDLSDLIQTQLVSDIRTQYNPKWTRRGLWDKPYSEAWKPKVPSMLLELFSHQNLADVRFGLDPRFRFTVSRAIYKGMLRFLAGQASREAIVQPLAPDHFVISIIGTKRVRLSWKAVSDPLEASAESKQYKIYTRQGDGGFDAGKLTAQTSLELDLEKEGAIYSFRVSALNEGGESFPSEVLSVCLLNNGKQPVLIVNAFDRICGPKIIDTDGLAGVAWWDDQGVPYISDIGQVGRQYDFNRKVAWTDDDNPGWGASYADMEGKVVLGNTFDFVHTHGKAIANAGYSFVSMSNEVFEEQNPSPDHFSALDVLFGEQRSTPNLLDPQKKDFRVYTPDMIASLQKFAEAGTPLFISGAYIGTDMTESKDSLAIGFAKEYLHYTWRSNHADNVGELGVTDFAPVGFPTALTFNTIYNPNIYTVESPDGIMPFGKDAVTLYRYLSNGLSAGVYNRGKTKTLVLGFPFETISAESERNALMQSILSTFEANK